MFEHFGFKDIFIGLWKFKYLIIGVTVIIAVLGNMGITAMMNSGIDVGNNEIYSFSKVCCFNNKDLTVDKKGGFTENELARMYNAILQKNFVKKAVLENISEKYSNEQIIEIYDKTFNSDLSSKNEIKISEFGKFLEVKTMADNMCIEYTVSSSDEQFTRDLIACYSEYLENSTKELNENIDVIYIDEIEGHLEAEEEQGISSIVKNKFVAVVCVLSVILVCFAVFVVLIINPTMNRMSDFEEYRVPVLGEWER